MTTPTRFGQFISEKRTQNSMTKQELAERIGISTAYLSQIESGVRSNPKDEILESLITCLHLSREETYTLYDLYAEITNTVELDISSYIKQNTLVKEAIRAAERCDISESIWREFIEKLNK